MLYTQPVCAKCAREQIRRNGSSGGRAKYQCKACAHQGYFQPASVEKARQYAQGDQLLLERNSLRRIVRPTGVARNTMAKRVKKAQLPAPWLPRLRPKKAQRKRWEALEREEMWTLWASENASFGKRKLWRWLAVERDARRIVAWGLGSRGTATRARLWRALPRRSRRHTQYFPDAWRAYPQRLPAQAHVVGMSGTRVVEARNGKRRHRGGVLVRRSRSVSKCRTSHHNRIKIAIDHLNAEITVK
jgi:IS1 family transposase